MTAAERFPSDLIEPVGTSCVDGQPLSASDVERNLRTAAEARDRLCRALRAIARNSRDAAECRDLLAMIGIDVDEARLARAANGGGQSLPH